MAYWILKAVLTPLIRCLYRLEVVGKGNAAKRGPVILASNHQSFIDSVFIPLVVSRRVTFVAKAEYFEKRRTAWIFRALGQIPIQRGGGSASDRALASAREVLRAGGVLGIYPEGTRSADGRLYKGHTGVARLALSCQATVVPMALAGTAAVQPIGAMRPRIFRRVTVRIGAPLTWTYGPGEAEHPAVLRQVTEEIMAAVAELSGQERVDHYGRRGGARPDPGAPRRRQTDRRAEGPEAITDQPGGPRGADPGMGAGAGQAEVDLSDAALRILPRPEEADRPETASFRR